MQEVAEELMEAYKAVKRRHDFNLLRERLSLRQIEVSHRQIKALYYGERPILEFRDEILMEIAKLTEERLIIKSNLNQAAARVFAAGAANQ